MVKNLTIIAVKNKNLHFKEHSSHQLASFYHITKQVGSTDKTGLVVNIENACKKD